ncbi:MAG: hypothetical protein U0K60_04975 [Parafannyhessea umbonata]|nr:hypothetical protein [Parafannyhessea umbonata]
MYLALEALLLCLVEIGEYADWDQQVVQITMYTAILINAAVVARRFFKTGASGKAVSNDLVAYALFATAAADFFMTLIGAAAAFLPGVILFCVVQTIYALYFDPHMRWLPVRIALFAIGLLLVGAAGLMSLHNAFGLLDLSLLLVNVVLAWVPERDRTSWLFRVGIALFLCCDCSVALRGLTTGSVHDVINALVWVFYIPSQVSLTLSYIGQLSGSV